MNQAFRTLSIIATVVGLTACSPKQPTSALPDTALRLMLGVRTLSGSFTLPLQQDYFEVAVCKYENGKRVSYEPIISGPRRKANDQLKPQLLWGNIDGKMTVCLSLDGSGAPWEDPFWKSLDGPIIVNQETPQATPEGWTILGYTCSQATQSGTSDNSISSNLNSQLAKSKRMGALVIRTFRNEEEWRRTLNERSKTNQTQAPLKLETPK